MKKYYKGLVCSKKNRSGRNNTGKIMVRRKGGGVKKLYRKIHFNLPFEENFNNYKLIRIEYDPNRSSFIGLVYDFGSEKKNYIILPEGLKVGDFILNSRESSFKMKSGFRTSLESLPLGTLIHNISLNSTKCNGSLCRANSTYAKILQKNVRGKYVRVKLPSGEERLIYEKNKATVGSVSNITKSFGRSKAGRSRKLGKRPSVRGVAMNPVDHPHGGGEGKTSGGRCSVTPWGKITKGQPTVKKKTPLIILRRNQT
jgi:large subunit ribosomal protein L2